ncbi:MAG: hypothetical protein RLZZ501_169 [Pseudomonadota bacterium]|jgi:hypothetical protein
MRPHLKIATPCFGGQVGHLYMLSVVRLLQDAPGLGFDASLALLGGDALVARARSTLVAAFLDAPEATHLLFIDADIAFAPDQVTRLLAAGKDFAAAFYPLKTIDWARLPARHVAGEPLTEAGLSYVGLPCQGAEAKRDGRFVTARLAGGGFQLLTRAAIERMVAAYPETHFAATDTYPPPPEASRNLYALFDSMIDPDSGIYLSEDYAFCRRWRAIGGEIWLDLDSRLTHTGPTSFAGDFSRRSAGLS